jgi:hypothetical protein
MEHTILINIYKYMCFLLFKSVSTDCHEIAPGQQEVHARSFISKCFWSWQPPQGHPGDHAGMEALQNLEDQ